LIDTIKDVFIQKDKVTPDKVTPIDFSISSELIGVSEVMQDIFYKIEKIAPTDANILILGENGTGKDLIAKAIHIRSLRAQKPLNYLAFCKTDR
jgi:two-component system response regulator HydG